jgi:hypothetical protein
MWLMADHPEVADLAGQAAYRLAPFTGLHMTPLGRLHMTTLVVGPAEQVTDPHITPCYSTAYQPARPIIHALGMRLSTREISVRSLSLVCQDGPEREWTWTTISSIRLGVSALA